ncbi:MAG: permease [Bacilli bacterium]
MKWLSDLLWLLIHSISGTFEAGSWQQIVQSSVQFFIYDLIKIVVLLCLLIFAVSYVQSYFPPEKTKQILSKYKGIKANIIGALLGTVTPFCSCSSIPIFIGFTRAGLSSGVTFSFLISSPLVDLGSFILLASIFGFPIAIAYVFVGLVLAVIGGTIIEKTGIGNQVQDFVLRSSGSIDIESPNLTKKERARYAFDQVWTTFKKVIPYILIGIAVGSVIHNVIPESWILFVLGPDNPFSVVIATLIGVPFYADIFGTIPIAEALVAKGVGIGTVLSFMMSVTALSLPSLIMLKKVVKWKLLLVFILIVVVGIILIGYGFNLLQLLIGF